MSFDRSTTTRRNRLVLAGIVTLVVAVASLAIFQKRRAEVARQSAERAERVERAQEEAGAEREAEREWSAQREQERIATQQREEVEREALAQAELQHLAAEAERNLEQRRRRAGEQARQDRERQLAEQERLAAEREKEEEEGRGAAELGAQREAEEQAKREEDEKRADDEAANAQVEPMPADADLDDTPDVDTESSIDDVSDQQGWSVKGDLRPILHYENEEGRDGDTTRDGSGGARLRLQAIWGITKGLRIVGRFAGTCFTEDCDLELVFDSSSDNGLSGGQFTLDELFVHRFRRQRFDVALGRLQTKFVLRGGVYAKSLDRNDSNNVNVTWTDGIQSTFRGKRGWSHHFVLQRNASDGSGSIRHGPLDFDDSGARNTYFLGFENIRGWGAVTQRAFDVSFLPDSLLKDGDPDGRREDYWGLVGRLATRWPQRTEGLRLRAGLELGYAPETPTAAAVGLDGSGEVDGLAWDIVVSAMDFAPGHSIGLNYARSGPGWLLSPQFRPNEELLEIRYQWQPERFPLLEARIRRRDDLEQLTAASQKREAFDFYLRLTWSFLIKDF